jgi:hypothetical protein
MKAFGSIDLQGSRPWMALQGFLARLLRQLLDAQTISLYGIRGLRSLYLLLATVNQAL